MDKDKLNQKIGILGGGQLGKMLCQAGSKLGLNLNILEKDNTFPAFQVTNNFTFGSILSFDDVIKFGENNDIITIEIENVNLEALEELEKKGKKVFPKPNSLKIIKDKGLQKIFYEGSGFPSSEFALYDDKDSLLEAIKSNVQKFPFVQKLRKDGYDGRGVHVVRKESDLGGLLEGSCLAEELVEIDKEIAIIVVRNPSGQLVCFPPVEMHFHPTANLVEYLFCPSDLNSDQIRIADKLALEVAEKLDIVGLLAVEMFLNKSGEILINEVAPRPHNSGHHTIEACNISQYEMHLRAILDLPLPKPTLNSPAVMVNLLGESGFQGRAYYEGLEDCLAIDGVHPHIYGKKETKPFRKMGHVTIIDQTLKKAIDKAILVRKTIKVVSK